jgi:hypothetical protein
VRLDSNRRTPFRFSLDVMQRHCHSILKCSLFTGPSTTLLQSSHRSFLKVLVLTSNRSMSNYANDLSSWASTGQRLGNVEKLGKTPMARQQRDDLQLIGAQIFFRHGARTPLRLLPGIEEVRRQQCRRHTARFSFRSRTETSM